MRVRRRRISLLLLLTLSLPFSAAVADASRAKPGSVEQLGEPAVPKAGDASTASKTLASPPVPKPGDPNNKDAPVDGLDGRPKIGPFVDKKKPIAVVEDLTVGGKPISQDLVKGGKDKLDGWLVPEPDSVMEDRPHDDATKKGPTGLEGGISEKDRERKEKEEKGEAPEPKVPARYPEKADAGSSPGDYIDPKKYGNKDKEKEKQKEEDAKKDTEGKFKPLEKPAHLPGKPHDIPHPAPPGVPDTSNKKEPPANPITNDDLPSSRKHDHSDDEEEEGVDRPFHAAWMSFTMIIFTEAGDKTFLIAALMAMRHARFAVFTAAFSALIAMTVLSAAFGHASGHIINDHLTHAAASVLFFIFGVKLLREGLAMSPHTGVGEEMKEVEMELEEKEQTMARRSSRRASQISPYALEAGIRVGRRSSRGDGRLPTHRSPSSSPSPSRSPSPSSRGIKGIFNGLSNLVGLLLSPVWVQTFAMTFLGEWGDRSQIATIAMAAGQDYWFTTFGAVAGHGACTGIAVLGGRWVAGKISMRLVMLGGGAMFLVFGIIYAVEAWYES